ncbi:MAG: GldM family protein [Bacteroidota bacterium]
MMYLVLLALLAMNVSKEVLDAFDNLKLKLQVSAENAQENGIGFIDGMKAEIREEIENEGKTTNEGLLDTLDMISGKTAAIINKINGHMTQMDSIAGRDPETGELEKKDELEKNLQYWMKGADGDELANGGRGGGQAYKLRNDIDQYTKDLVAIYNFNAVDSARINDAELQTRLLQDTLGTDGDPKSWERYTFDAPVVANMAILEALKLDIYEKQKELLDLLNNRLGVATFKVDKVVPIDAPISAIVPAGLQYETRLYVAMSSSAIKPKFSASSGSVKTAEDGNSATLTIPASGSVIPKNGKEGIQKYTANIQVPKATGGYDNLTVEGQFVVRKPEIVVTSAAIQVLYLQCGNDVNIDVPALGDQYKPNITASSAQVIPSKSVAKKFRIVPSAKTCRVTVNSITNGKKIKIGDVDYKVIRPPKPTIDMAVNGKPTSGATPVPKTSRVQVRLVPDADFRSNLPEDARYMISSIDVLAQLSLGPPTKVNSVSASGKDATKAIAVSLGTQVRQARPGTKVYIRINNIYRINFANKRVEEKFTEVERMLSIVVR